MLRYIAPLFRLPSQFQRRLRRLRLRTMLLLLTTILLVTITPLYLIYKPPSSLIQYFQNRWPDVLFQVKLPPSAGKLIALTIDDAPSEYTTAIAELLAVNGATATFFVIGAQADAAPNREQELWRLVRAGHELGNHGFRDEMARSLSDEVLKEQIETVRSKINDIYATAHVDTPPEYFRPGSGFFSENMRKLVKDLGYRIVLGSVYPHDAQISMASVNAKHVLSMAKPGGIIICHDRRSWTVDMLATVLPELTKRGYKIVTVSELLRAAGKLPGVGRQ